MIYLSNLLENLQALPNPEHYEALRDVRDDKAEIMMAIHHKNWNGDQAEFSQGNCELPLMMFDPDWSEIEEIVVYVMYYNSDWSCKMGHIMAHDTKPNTAHMLAYGPNHPMVLKGLQTSDTV